MTDSQPTTPLPDTPTAAPTLPMPPAPPAGGSVPPPGGGAIPPAGDGSSPSGPSETARIASKALSITIGVLGGIALVISGAGVAFSTVHAAAGSGESSMQTLDGMREASALNVDMARGDLRVSFENVDAPTLTTSGGAEWRLVVDGDEIAVETPFEPWSGFGWRDIGGLWDDEQAVLALPRSMEGLDLDVDLGAGQLVLDGAFGDVGASLGAGVLEVSGEARVVDLDLSAGYAELDLDGVREASFDLSAGQVDAAFRGDAPDAVTIDVSAGYLDLVLPDAEYAVTQDVSAGGMENALRQSARSSHLVDVAISAGYVDLSSR